MVGFAECRKVLLNVREWGFKSKAGAAKRAIMELSVQAKEERRYDVQLFAARRRDPDCLL